MSVIGLLIVLVIVGVILYVLNSVVPMDPRVRTIINAVAIVAVCLWVLSAFGLLPDDWAGRHYRR